MIVFLGILGKALGGLGFAVVLACLAVAPVLDAVTRRGRR